MTIAFVTRGPIYSPPWTYQYQPSWMIRPYGTAATAVVTAQPFFNPMVDIMRDPFYQPSQMLRLPFIASSAVSVVTEIFYKPYFITVGHMGFLGTY